MPPKRLRNRVAPCRAPASIATNRESALIKRYLLVVGAILAVLAGALFLTKPKEGEIRRSVDEAMAAYTKAQAAAPAGTMREISLPKITGEHDWILARSYSAEQDGKSFSCWGVSIVTVCDAPD